MNDFYVYGHYAKNQEIPFYVGKGRNNRAYQSTGRSVFWHRVTNKYGFEVKILYNGLEESAALSKEMELIAEYGRRDLGTGCLVNLTDGGEGVSGKVVSDECRAKISEANKRRVLSDETKQKISKSLTGKLLSDETKLKMSSARTGMKYATGHPWSEKRKKAWSAAMSGENNPMYGKSRQHVDRDINGRFV